ALDLDSFNVLNIYQFGSRVYNCFDENSDWDFVIVVDANYVFENSRKATITCHDSNNHKNHKGQTKTHQIEACVYNIYAFQLCLQEHYIFAILCLFLPSKFVWRNKEPIQFQLNLSKLRSSLSREAHRTWVKAKKKFTIENKKDLV